MGVGGWHTFTEACLLLVDHPDVVQERLAIQAEFAARLAERILQEVEIDGIIFHEPIADQHGPLISPRMYAGFVLKSFEPVWEVLDRFSVPAIIFRSYANPRSLLPVLVRSRINCLWACEANPVEMDYRSIREQYGPDLRLIGGIDTDVLRQGEDAIRREVEEKVPSLLKQGGYIPLADGRVRAYVPFANYSFYRRLLEQIVIRQDQQE
jgi:uroporphyrinogen decarboxylase